MGGPVHERRWPASLTVLVVLGLQLAMPDAVDAGPHWLLPAIEGLLLLPLFLANPIRLTRDVEALHWFSIALTLVLLLANAVHLVRLVNLVLSGRTLAAGDLVQAAVLIWTTNIAATALAMWQGDRDGPFARMDDHPREAAAPDLLFPQMTGVPGWDASTWHPGFLDYLFVAFTSATAFSPTDTMPLSARAKLLMAFTSVVSLLTLAVVAARAVNVV